MMESRCPKSAAPKVVALDTSLCVLRVFAGDNFTQSRKGRKENQISVFSTTSLRHDPKIFMLALLPQVKQNKGKEFIG